MNDHINQIIRKVGENGHISIDSNNQYLFRAALRLESENILRRNEKNFYFKDIGQHIYKLGSYEKYQIELDEQKQHQKKLDDATIDAAQSAKTSKKWGIIGVSVSSILAFFSLLLNIYQFRDSVIKDDSLKEINKKLKQQDSLLLIQQKLQPKIDSLLYQKPLKK